MSRNGLGGALRRAALLLIFYGLLTPVALVLRMLGRDPLRLRPRHGGPMWLPHRGSDEPVRYDRPF